MAGAPNNTLQRTALRAAAERERSAAEGRMKRPKVLTVLAILGMVNGLVAIGLGLSALFGNRFLFEPDGVGPNRVAIASLFGPLSEYAGWIMIVLGTAVCLAGYGLFALNPWGRRVVFAALSLLFVATSVAVGWGVWQREAGVVIFGLLKLGVIGLVCWYLQTPAVRSTFSVCDAASMSEPGAAADGGA